MALTAGSNIFTRAEDSVRALLAKSSDVRAFLGVATEEDAQARIYTNELPRTDDDRDDYTSDAYLAQFPCCIVQPPEDGKWFTAKQTALDGLRSYDYDWSFVIRFEAIADASKDEQEQIRAFQNAVGDGLEDMLDALSGEPGTLGVTEISAAGMFRADFRRRQDLGHVLVFAVRVDHRVE